MSVTLYAAIDIAAGRAVRLHQGARERVRVVADDPVALALTLARAGAPFLHVVDLDAAFGDGDNADIVARVVAAVPCPTQVGGGIRDAARLSWARRAGAARVVLGTAADRQPELLAAALDQGPDTVVVAADARAGRVVVAGWTETGGDGLAAYAGRMRAFGVRHLLVTAVERDGTGAGPDHTLLSQALDAFGAGVIASGGVGSIADVAALTPLAASGLTGVVVGSLLVDGRATVAELLAAVGAD